MTNAVPPTLKDLRDPFKKNRHSKPLRVGGSKFGGVARLPASDNDEERASLTEKLHLDRRSSAGAESTCAPA